MSPSLRHAGTTFVAAALLAATARGQTTFRVSVDSSSAQADGYSAECAISADGRFVAFSSIADNLVAGDTNGANDVFVRDLAAGTTELVSVQGNGNPADADSFDPAISSDGRFVAFESDADDLVSGDTNHKRDIFVHDRATGSTVRASVDSSGVESHDHCFAASISSDGQLVTFESGATNLVGGDTNKAFDVFVRDLTAGTTTRVSVDSNGAQGNGSSGISAISADGAFVAFSSDATNLVAGDTNGMTDVFVHERATGATTRVSVASDGTQANADSGYDVVAISSDGHVVAFESTAKNLVANDHSQGLEVFVHDSASGSTERVSIADDGSDANGGSGLPTISADGNSVAFESGATNLVAGDVDGVDDVFVRDRAAASTRLVSVTCSGRTPDQACEEPTMSADATLVAWSSFADDLVDGDTNATRDVFLTDLSFVVDDASWSNYGAGHPGTLGIPALVASAAPAFGTTITVSATDSSTGWAVGFLVVGLQQASLPFAGGTLLVQPLVIPTEPIASWGWSATVTIPRDDSLCNVSIFLQMLELDPGASRGLSMSPGLELHVGK